MTEHKETVIFDLDGTLANCDHRRHLVECDEPDWPAFFAACVDDKPNWPVIRTLEILSRHFEVLILSGRSSEVADQTMDWINAWLPAIDLSVVMRDEGDYTPDHRLKEYWIDHYGLTPENVFAVYDDRDTVVAMWRRRGFPCFQVAEGSF